MVSRFSILQREPFLLSVLVLIIAAFFSATTFASRTYHRKQTQFGERWFERGERALKQGHPGAAVDGFRNALVFARDNDLYRLRLAQSLMADNRLQEARAHLLSLWEKQPGDGTLNLELARLAAAWRDTRQAARYYHAAIYGVWPDDPMPHRLDARFELSEYLLKRNDTLDAQAELVALAAMLPPQDAGDQVRLGNMLLRAGLNARALAAFRNALATAPNDLPALAGAGESAFRTGDYYAARHYLLPVSVQDPHDQHAMELLNVSELVIRLDPFEHGVPARERARRAVRDYQTALAKAEKCSPGEAVPPPPPPASATANPEENLTSLLRRAESMNPKMSATLLARNPDALDRTMDLVFKLERAAASCGTPSPADKALTLLGERREAMQ